MRLLELKDDGDFSLTKDIVNNTLPYAILSHTWGPDNDEVNFEDLTEGRGKTKAGYRKLQFCGRQAIRDGLQYFWVDTCCINKSNNTELSEAINSMFRWYRDADRCYVYLSDVSTSGHDRVDSSLSALRESRWFTRGWTLQELIAPRSVEFFCLNGNRLGDKKSLERQLHEITGISLLALQGTPLSAFSIKERISWAENREPKREEDRAYSLLGIFDIHMPLIYGEGAKNAFERFQEEVDKRLRKHQLDELSTGIQAANSPKRLKAMHNQPLSVPPSHNPNFFHPKPLGCPEFTTHNNALETQKGPATKDFYSIDPATKQSLVNQIYFTKIDERLTNLPAAQGTTCHWFLSKPEYVSWHNLAQQPDHGGFLWIKGNPGTGKSTLMKLLFEEAKLNAKGDSSQITLSFFFLARGTFEEKSTIGLYRSLLHQLFQKAVESRNSLDWITTDGARVIQRNGWGEEALKQTLKHAILELKSRSLAIFIDALDECDKNQAIGMICFSSRHYPTIIIQKGIEVTLEDEAGHIEDIRQYIKSNLRLGKSKQAESLQSEILEKSSGIFLWVALVLGILNSKYPESSISIKNIREHLKEIPPKLTDLFEMILIQDKENLRRLQLCLQWILFATYPLQPQELYFAIQFGLDKECLGYWDQEDIELDQIKTFVRTSSKGLAEVTRNEVSEVQFIHESVRDFLLGKYEGQWSGVSGNFVGYSHEILRDCCLASINQGVNIPDSLTQGWKAVQFRGPVRFKFPFLEYSVLNVLRHANSAQQNGMEQGEFLIDFPLQRWILLNNTLERSLQYTETASLLYVLAGKNLPNLIRIHPQRESCFDVESERYGMPILAALASKSQGAIQVFLEVQAEIHPQKPLLRHLCKQYSENIDKSVSLSHNFTFSRQRSVFFQIAEQGNNLILIFLCASGKLDLESKDDSGGTPLSWAAVNGNAAVVKLLLEKGADPESRDNNGRTPLSWAAVNWYEAVVKLLLEKGADLESKDNNGQTPLSWAANYGLETVIKLLLEKGADLESKDNNGQTPLSWAAHSGREAVIKLLLEKGADLESKDNNGRTPLSWAANYGLETVIKLLLEKGADYESKDNNGRTPLSWAAVNWYEVVVKLLLENGADSESKDDNGLTPLSWAAQCGHKTVLKLLLEKGADIESRDNNGRTPLSWAAVNWYEAVVKLLLEKGADLESKDDNGRTPLSWAAQCGHKAVIKLLLEKGADYETKDNNDRRPLSWATMNRHEVIARALFKQGLRKF